MQTRASNDPSRKFKFYNHTEGPYKGVLQFDSALHWPRKLLISTLSKFVVAETKLNIDMGDFVLNNTYNMCRICTIL